MFNVTLINESKEFEITAADMEYLNNNEVKAIFSEIPCHTLIPNDFLLILIELSQSIGANAAYDAFKYLLKYLFDFIQSKLPKKEKPTEIKVICGDKAFICQFTFKLTEEQKDKFVEAAADQLHKM